jgi:hypothetical protein
MTRIKSRFFLFTLLQGSFLLHAQQMNAVLKQKELLFETNSGYHDLTSTTKTVFVSYVLSEKIASGQFYEDRRMIIEEFMAGVNFASESAVLTIEQFWNGVKVQQYVVKPALKGTPAFIPKLPLLFRPPES